MATSLGIIILAIGFALYLGFRLEGIHNIWGEIDEYEAEIEAEFMDFLSEEYFEPTFERLTPFDTSEIKDLMSEKDFEIEPIRRERERLINEGVPEKEVKNIIGQLIFEEIKRKGLTPGTMSSENIDISDIVSLLPSESEKQKLPAEVLLDNHEDEESWEVKDFTSLAFQMNNYQNDLLDPSKVFSETKSFYRKYSWPKRLYTTILEP